MGLAVVYFGISQSLFAVILMFIKKPLSIADKILGVWLSFLSIFFVVNLIQFNAGVTDRGGWPAILSTSLTFPSFLYLYSKYITKEYGKFKRSDLLHFLPAVFGFLFAAIIYKNEHIYDLQSFDSYYTQKSIELTIVAFLQFACIIFYAGMAHISIKRYRRQISNFYSFQSHRISLNWLRVILISFLLLHCLIIPMSVFYREIPFSFNLHTFRNSAYLVFIYVLSLWGLKQQQLISDFKPLLLNRETDSEVKNSTRYQKSGLKDEQAEAYLKELIDYMNSSEAWKDSELSLAKISNKLKIPKHQISQILNEKLKKNFYTFVNEYRTEYAKKLIVSPKHKNWSFLAIAYECGFNSKTAFNNFFKKYTNMTPTEYKSKATELKKSSPLT
nr:helix-turn-helix transcriptional regulator [uncultured Draconibacterium sp.]